MGKRKSAAKPPPRKKPPKIPSVFDCPKCNVEKCVEVSLNTKDRVGSVTCRNCGEKYDMKLKDLDEGIDVYTAWCDELDREAEDQ
jgi:transcription elongation factor Elf1